MAYSRNETALVGKIVAAVKIAHPTAWVLKAHGNPMQRSGVPDLLISFEGRFFGVEVKHRKPGESIQHMLSRVTLLQHEEMRRMRLGGAVTAVVWEVEQALEVLALGLLDTPTKTHYRL